MKIQEKLMDMNQPKPIIAIIHAEWCPHCTRIMQPENDSIWHQVKQSCEPYYSVEDYESNDPNTQPFIEKYQINARGYPTIVRKLPESDVEYYNGIGEPFADDIIRWAKGGANEPQMGGKKSILKKTKSTKKSKKAKKTEKKRVCWLF